jgi:anti-sigma regulatory factor (Ser/Thr protein kinase)
MGDNAELVNLVLPCEPSAARSVRDALRGSLDLGSKLDEVMLVATELVTNAVVHSGADERHALSVAVSRSDSAVLISVRDPGLSASEAKIRAGRGNEVEGWGLMLVEQLSNRWGTERNGSYLVWAQLELTPRSARRRPSGAPELNSVTGR